MLHSQSRHIDVRMACVDYLRKHREKFEAVSICLISEHLVKICLYPFFFSELHYLRVLTGAVYYLMLFKTSALCLTDVHVAVTHFQKPGEGPVYCLGWADVSGKEWKPQCSFKETKQNKAF